ncbi:glycosyltransferase family 31 protein [Aulographum hederae CBS 113979]|uniref:N-acetylgalactosaminide beta-1,3-galactosyltransferase n=1 Tax=Aulographum hederae CBS 113979 TaxID=1176131 RepID=A0A6G1GNS5_9PEZI|nr:glycosyltransferase family 31 protein [Aulographum hederae CBS 113979]
MSTVSRTAIGRTILLAFIGTVLTITFLLSSRAKTTSSWRTQPYRFNVYPNSRPNTTSTDTQPIAEEESVNVECPELKGAEDVVVVVKTGATEAAIRLPVLLKTSLRCVPPENVLIFSDMEQDIEDFDHHVYDALEGIPESATNDNSDFDVYRKQQELRENGQDAQIPSLLSEFEDPRIPGTLAAWTLDKYKNLNMVKRSGTMVPDKKWYIFIDADTYLVWSTTVAWLNARDHKKETFFGSPSYIAGKEFAHGGSGMFLSGGGMQTFLAHNKTVEKFNKQVQNECCGDFVLALALDDMGIKVTSAWPTIHGDYPSTIAFGYDRWCHPMATMHHVSVADMQQIGLFEQERKNPSKPLLYSELYRNLVSRLLSSSLEDWDNSSGWDYHEDDLSYDDCDEKCRTNGNCFQFSYNGKECYIQERFRLGTSKKAEDDKRWRSVWRRKRIMEWIESNDRCDPIKFPEQKND